MIDLLGEKIDNCDMPASPPSALAKEPAYIALPLVAPDNERHEPSLIEIREFQRNSDTCRHSGKKEAPGLPHYKPGHYGLRR